jgi:uncharacterized protein YoxC
MPRPTRRDEMGIVGVILTIVIIFALLAVIELTRTLEAAQQINTTVQNITGSVKGANTHLSTGCAAGQSDCSDALPVLTQTEGIVDQINTAAKPLSGQAGQILTAVNSINTTASAILSSASSINTTVHSINSSVSAINANVNSIGSSISGVNTDVTAIKGTNYAGPGTGLGISGIDQRVDVVIATVNGIKSDTGTINAEAGGIETQAKGICNDSVSGAVLPVLPGVLKVC